MLYLTNSFYRCLKPACENLTYKILPSLAFSQLSCRSTICSSVYNQRSSFIPFIHNSQQCRLLANKRKRFRSKKPFANSNAEITVKSMGDSFQPSLNHVSYGGQFDVLSEDESQSWIQLNNSASTTNDNRSIRREIPPNFRIWEPVGKWSNTYDGTSFKFKVVSYNVLAQCLLESYPHLYKNCYPHDLKWHVRATRLYTEILHLEPDILCLQEVQASHLSSFYSKFEEMGYYGVFKQKTGHRKDGCAIYFKRSMFNLEDHLNVEFYQPDLPMLNRDNVGIALRLSPRNPRAAATPFVIATTHLQYHPKRTDLRLAQIQLFLAEIDRFAYYNDGKQAGYYPIILTGDLNSPPNSAIIQLLGKGHVCAAPFRDDSDWRRIGVTDNCQHLSVYLSRQRGISADTSTLKIFNSEHDKGYLPTVESADGTEEYGAMFNSGELTHPLCLASVYGQHKPDGAPEATTFQNCWLTVDYIYFSRCSTLRLLERLRLPTEEECMKMGPLPNHVYGSDHLALAALFELKQPTASL
ncbi:protein angel isoform X1 [Papilio machaon]|uniref:protein angel isoform X1 n=2 Tax=Papilio machaon TaxID=76193 RepID=UPI001E663B0F|nr:protein angel isoform X1 [Papilio machaon]XP_014370123.2 protein angel isoform X1 [Papilio machaon]